MLSSHQWKRQWQWQWLHRRKMSPSTYIHTLSISNTWSKDWEKDTVIRMRSVNLSMLKHHQQQASGGVGDDKKGEGISSSPDGILLQLVKLKLDAVMKNEKASAKSIVEALSSLRLIRGDYQGINSILSALSVKLEALPASFDISFHHLVLAFHGLRHVSLSTLETASHCTSLVNNLKRRIKSEELTTSTLGHLLYCLSNRAKDSPLVNFTIELLSPSIQKMSENLQNKYLAMSIYGLQSVLDTKVGRQIISRLSIRARSNNQILSSEDFGMSMAGLKFSKCDTPEMVQLVNVLTQKILESEAYQAKDLADALFGLQKATSANPSINKLLSILATKINSNKENWTHLEISRSFYGLQNVNIAHDGGNQIFASLASKLSACKDLFPPQSLAMTLYGLRANQGSNEIIRQILNNIYNKFGSVTENLNELEIGMIFSGLQCMSSHSLEVRNLIDLLTTTIVQNNIQFSSLSIHNCLYSMKFMSSDYAEVRNLLISIINRLEGCDLLPPDSFSFCVYGLRNMNSFYPEVRQALKVLATKLNRDLPWNRSDVTNVIFGLQNCSTQHEEVQEIVNVVNNVLETITFDLKPVDIGMILFGLKSNVNSCTVTQQLLKRIVPAINHCFIPFSAHHIAMSLFGLQRMQANSIEIKEILMIMNRKLVEMKEKMRVTDISMSFYGLQHMNGNSTEVREVIQSLTTKLRECNTNELSGYAICNILYGLKSMNTKVPEARAVLDCLHSHLVQLDCAMNPYELALSYEGLQGMRSDSQEVQCVLSWLHGRLSKCSDLSPQNIARIMSGLQTMSNNTLQVRDTLAILQKHIIKNDSRFEISEIGTVVQGLQNMQVYDNTLSSILQFTSKLLLTCEDNDALISPTTMANILHGLRRIGSDSNDEFLRLLQILNAKIKSAKTGFKSHEFVNAIIGIEGGSSEKKEVREILNSLKENARQFPFELTAWQVTLILRSLWKKSNKYKEVKEFLQFIRDSLEKCNHEQEIFIGHVCSAFSGFQNMDSKYGEIFPLLDLLKRHVVLAEMNSVSPRNLAISMYGLRQMNIEGKIVLELLEMIFSRRMEKLCLEQWQIAAIANSLKHRKNEHKLFRNIVDFLVDHISHSTEIFTPNHIAMIFEGLSNFVIDAKVDRLLEGLRPKVSACNNFKARDLSRILFGLQNMKIESHALKSVVLSVAVKMMECKSAFSAQSLAVCFYGLKSMRNNCKEVKYMLTALLLKLSQCHEPFSAIEIGYSLAGLKFMNSEEEEMAQILAILCDKTEKANDFHPHTIIQCLSALQFMNLSHSTVSNLFRVVSSKIENCRHLLMSSTRHREREAIIKLLETISHTAPDRSEETKNIVAKLTPS